MTVLYRRPTGAAATIYAAIPGWAETEKQLTTLEALQAKYPMLEQIHDYQFQAELGKELAAVATPKTNIDEWAAKLSTRIQERRELESRTGIISSAIDHVKQQLRQLEESTDIIADTCRSELAKLYTEHEIITKDGAPNTREEAFQQNARAKWEELTEFRHRYTALASLFIKNTFKSDHYTQPGRDAYTTGLIHEPHLIHPYAAYLVREAAKTRVKPGRPEAAITAWAAKQPTPKHLAPGHGFSNNPIPGNWDPTAWVHNLFRTHQAVFRDADEASKLWSALSTALTITPNIGTRTATQAVDALNYYLDTTGAAPLEPAPHSTISGDTYIALQTNGAPAWRQNTNNQ
ncbi:hypothetical protein D9V30_05175 [Mycetocola reblochoni]|uniref:Uncharacterized protein n=1 Tax=Mycetocola reblochoni TaxID=331618 RepID=A0A3L6ZQJ1_9MICO|nr:hypothetical protein [Mycetocola reblochoni]RLP70059.1 hypothetical protein D9V30_05175 [Mycetocola reblochoni]